MKKSIGLGLGMTFCAFFFQACESSDSVDELNQILADSKELSSTVATDSLAVPVSAYNVEYVRFLDALSTDIVSDTTIASKFASSPEKYCQEHGFDIQINMDSGLLKLILALGDEGMVTAAKNGDVKTFVALCRSKGLLNLESFEKDPYILGLISKLPGYTKAQNGKILGNTVSGTEIEEVALSAVAVYGCLLVAIAAAAAEAFVVLGTTTWVVNGQSLDNSVSGTAVQQMWNLKGNKDYQVSTELTNEIVSQGLMMMKENFPEELANIDEKALKNILMLKIQRMIKNED